MAKSIRLSTSIGALKLKSPLIGASGLFGYGYEHRDMVDISCFGAIVTKTITLNPKPGNPPPRLVDLEYGLLNSIGLENVGYERWLEEELPKSKGSTRLIVSIGGETPDEFEKLASNLDTVDDVVAIELNVSCPNVEKGGMAFGKDADTTGEIVRRVKSRTAKTVIVKLPPLVFSIDEVAQAACQAGADAIAIGNTLPGLAIDIENQRPLLGGITGGLSGRPLKPICVRLVWRVTRMLDVPVIGVGGIESAQDAIEYILAGACAFAVGSVILKDVDAPSKIIKGLREFMERKGYSSLTEFRGKLNTEGSATL